MRKFALPQKQGWIIIIFSCILLACLGFGLFKAQRDAYAQASSDDWAKPINLSNSGGTSNPSIVIDANGTIHVIWQDAYKGTMYTGINGNVWNIPEAIILPFSPPISAQQPGGQAAQGPVPTFRVDNSGNIHAFWTDEQDRLFSSYVPSLNFSNPGSWSTPAQLAESAVDFDVVVDSQGQLHLAYVRALDSTEFPAGIY